MRRSKLILFFTLLPIIAITQSREQLEKERLQLINRIEFVKTILKKNENAKEITMDYINSVQIQIQNRDKILQNIQFQSQQINNEIAKKQLILDSLILEKKALMNDFSKLIRANYIHNLSKNKFIYLFSSSGWDDYLARKRYLRQYNNFVVKKIRIIKSKEKETKKLIVQIQKDKDDLKKFENAENENIKKLKEETILKSALLAKLNENEVKIRLMLEKQNTERELLNKNIESIIFSKLTENSPTSIAEPNISRFSDLKGKLTKPVGTGIITSKFGRHLHPTIPGVYVINKGIDLISEPFDNVKSVFSGEVVGLMYINGYDWMVIIKHDEYYSVYSKLQGVTISKGDMITTGQIIGKLSESGSFHFELWKNKIEQDPELWLKW